MILKYHIIGYIYAIIGTLNTYTSGNSDIYNIIFIGGIITLKIVTAISALYSMIQSIKSTVIKYIMILKSISKSPTMKINQHPYEYNIYIYTNYVY